MLCECGQKTKFKFAFPVVLDETLKCPNCGHTGRLTEDYLTSPWEIESTTLSIHEQKEFEMNTSPNPPGKNDKNRLPWQQFRTRDPSTISVFLDRGRAEIMFSMVVASNLSDDQTRELTDAAFGASNGNPEILRLLLEAFSELYPSDSDVFARIERHWRSFEQRGPDFDCIGTLRRICNEHLMPPTMIEAMFDDPTVDFVAYLDWHNS